VIQTILEQQKPEAAYFIAHGGRRTGILIVPGDGAMGPGFRRDDHARAANHR